MPVGRKRSGQGRRFLPEDTQLNISRLMQFNNGLVKRRLREFLTRYRLHASVILLCVISLAMLWAVIYVQFNVERERIIESKLQENDNLARVFEEHVARTVRAAEITLLEIRSEFLRSGRQFDLVQYAKDRGIFLDPYNSISVTDKNGDQILSNHPIRKPLNFKNSEDFQFHAQHDTQTLFFSKPRQGAITGKWTVYLSLRRNNADGSFAGGVTLGMDPGYFSRIYTELDLGKDAIVSMVGRDGIIRARSAGAKVTAGESRDDSELFTRYLPAADHGSYIGKGKVDGKVRILSYRALRDYPLVVVVGTSQAVALADYEKRRSTYIQTASALTAVILGLGLFALFQIARSERESEARRSSERLFRTLAEGSPSGIFRTDAAGSWLYVNNRWCEISGIRAEAARGDGWVSALHPDDRERVFGEWATATKKRQSFLSEYRCQKPDGTVTWVVGQARAETDPQDKTLGYVGTITDITERVQAEEEIQRARSLMQTVLDSTPDWIFAKDREYRLLFVNESFAASQGLKPKDMVGRPDTDFWPLEYCIGNPEKGIRGFHTDDDEGLAGRTLHNPADPATLANGTLRIFDTLKLPLRDTHGRIYGVLGYARDVTAQRRMEDALKARESRLNEAQRIAQIGNWELDLVANKLTWSDEIFRIFEIDKSKFGTTYEAFLNVIHPEDRETVNAAYTGSLVTRKPYDITHRLLMADGRIKYVHERCESEFDAEGKPLRSVGTVQDVTERKHAEQQAQRLSNILEGSLNEIYVFDANSLNFVMVNQGGRANLGYTMEELRELTPVDLKPEYSPESFAALVAPLRAGAQHLIRFSTVHRRKDGSSYPVEIHLQMFSDESPPVFVAVIIDITDRRKAEETLRQFTAELEQRVQERTAKLETANQELETFNYSVAHDLRAPLRGIDGYSRLLLTEHAARLDDEGRGFLQNIVRATKHMSQLLDDLLAYARLEQRDMEIAQVDPRALIESLLADRDDEIKARGVAVSVAVDCPSVRADREGLTLALRNLLENALKFTHNVPLSMIEVSGRDTGTSCILAVRDNGVGFDMKFHDRIFTIFQRLHRSEDYPGTGVGLAIVKKAMERMGGRAWAESEPGKGATFYLEIPK